MSDETRDAAAAEAEFLKIFEDADASIVHDLKKPFLDGFVGGYRVGRKIAADNKDRYSPEQTLTEFFIKANDTIRELSKEDLSDVRTRIQKARTLGTALGWFMYSIEILLTQPGIRIDEEYAEKIVGQVNVFAAKLKELERGIPLTEIKQRVRRIALANKGKLSKEQQRLVARIAATLAA